MWVRTNRFHGPPNVRSPNLSRPKTRSRIETGKNEAPIYGLDSPTNLHLSKFDSQSKPGFDWGSFYCDSPARLTMDFGK